MAISAPMALFIPGLGMGELALVLVLVLLLFGPGKLPQVAQSLGEAVNRFRRGASAPEEKKLSTEEPLQKPEPLSTDAGNRPNHNEP